jgi:hypothetical protein
VFPRLYALLISGLLTAALPALGCSSALPPSGWSVGGAQLSLPWARWDMGDAIIELRPDGTVLLDGEPSFVLDAAGRVYDPELAPLALLEPDGRLVGGDDRALGVVGSMHASLPGASEAWLSLMPDGTVVRYGDEGDRIAGGRWEGCQGPPQAAQACVLVTHLVLLDAELRRRQRGGPGFGFGIGVMIIR